MSSNFNWSNTTFTYRLECPCGKKVSFADKKARDIQTRLHKKVCEISSKSLTCRQKIDYFPGETILGQHTLYQGQQSPGDNHIHNLLKLLN